MNRFLNKSFYGDVGNKLGIPTFCFTRIRSDDCVGSQKRNDFILLFARSTT